MDLELLTTLIPIVAIGLIGLLVGGIIGGLIAGSMRNSNPKNGRTPGKNFAQILRIWRDRHNGKILVEMDGEYFPSIEKLSRRQKTAFLQDIDELQLWTGAEAISNRIQSVPTAPATIVQSTEILSDQPTDHLAVKLPDEPLTTPGEQYQEGLSANQAPSQAFTTVSVGAAIQTSNVTPPSLEMSDIFIRAIVPEIMSKEKETPKSIAAQVDEILQEKLLQSGLHNRAIRLMEIPEKGLVFMVDGKAYDGVSDIPDEPVRELIRECVAEWEKRG